MSEAIGIFVAGISGVFLGMAMLYGAIKIVSAIIGRFDTAEDKK